MTVDQFPIHKMHALIDLISELTTDKQQEFLNELVEELENDFKRRIQLPIDWNAVLNRLFDLADKYLEIKRIQRTFRLQRSRETSSLLTILDINFTII